MTCIENVTDNWRKLKWSFLNYSIASRLLRKLATTYETSMFLATIGTEAYDISNELKFDNEKGKMKLDIVIKN